MHKGGSDMGYLCLYINNTRIVLPKHFRNIVLVCGVFLLLMSFAAERAWAPPPGGPPGLQGLAGLNCWDLNGDGDCTLPAEDITGDGFCTVDDCIGPVGPAGPTYTGIAPVNVDNTSNEIGLNSASDGDLLMYDTTGNNWIAVPPEVHHDHIVGVDKRQPWLGLNYQIALVGMFPSEAGEMPFIGEIMLVGFNFAAPDWALCNGQLLPIASHAALFSLLGTNYGGDGETTFGLPDLRGRVPIHFGNGPGLSSYSIGQRGGSEAH